MIGFFGTHLTQNQKNYTAKALIIDEYILTADNKTVR
jgi:hypothetical protein